VRGRLGLAVLLSLAGAGVLLLALNQVWVEVEGAPGLSIETLRDRVAGGDLAPGARRRRTARRWRRPSQARCAKHWS
jgi:hypothetical protein